MLLEKLIVKVNFAKQILKKQVVPVAVIDGSWIAERKLIAGQKSGPRSPSSQLR